MRSRERAKAIKDTGRRCYDCGVKASVAKGKEVKLEVHHDPPIGAKWKELIDLIIKVVLESPQVPLCKSCHKERHEQMNHKETYKKHFKLSPDDVVLCEVCGKEAVDIHHILFKSQGGTNDIENLIGLCRCCHDAAHGKIKGQVMSRDYLFGIIENRI
jgi:predicted HNH restriction endonuclease